MPSDKVSDWIRRIDAITASFHESFHPLSENQLNWKPNAQVWSIAENMEHLIVVNESYYPVVEQIRKNQYRPPLMAKIGFYPRMLGNVVLKAVQPDRRKKMKTFPIWEPERSKITEGISKKFNQHQEELKSFIVNNTGLVEKNIVISSPANRNIVYHLPIAFEIIVTHELRHYHQAKEVMTMQMKKLGF